MQDTGCKMGFEISVMKRLAGYLIAGLLALGAFAADKDRLATLRTEFDSELARLDKAGLAQRTEIGALYIARLREVQLELQAQGQVRGLVAIGDEILRFSKSSTFPPAPTAAIPVELRTIQEQFLSHLSQAQMSNDMDVVRLTGRHVQALAAARTPFAEKDDKAVVFKFDDERDRVLALPRVRLALKTTEAANDPQAYLAQNGITTNVPASDYRVVKVFHPQSEDLETRLGYELTVALAQDDSRLSVRKSTGPGTLAHSEDGYTTHKPRLTLLCRNKSLPAGSRLIISYYTRSLVDRERKRASAEAFALPALERGQSHVIDCRGLATYRSVAAIVNLRGAPTESVLGSEFYGLVIEILDENNRPILQRFSPQSLERDLDREAEKNSGDKN